MKKKNLFRSKKIQFIWTAENFKKYARAKKCKMFRVEARTSTGLVYGTMGSANGFGRRSVYYLRYQNDSESDDEASAAVEETSNN